jgi:hypothetical protein
MGNEPEPDPHGNTLPMIFPRYTAPARTRVVLNVNPLIPPESRTSHGPAAHFGLASHVSSQVLGVSLKLEKPLMILMLTVHCPCHRAAEMGGVEVLTTRTDDRAERLPPRSAATRYRYVVAGARPVPWYDVTVPGTEAITLPSRRITYLSGAGPVAGRDQLNATEPVVEGPATSPAGRSSGGLFHGAQITRPTIRPSTATAAVAATGMAHRRRPRRTAEGTAEAAGMAEAAVGGGSAGACGPGGGRNPSWSVAVTPPSDTWAVQSVPSQ